MKQVRLFEQSDDGNLLPKQGNVQLFPDFFCERVANKFFERLKEISRWRQDAITVYGKKVLQPRLSAWYGDEGLKYGYSGMVLSPLPWFSELSEIKDAVELKCGILFNSALLNFYRNEKDGMGWHRDNEPELGKNPVIASVSFGETRSFYLRHHSEKHLKRHIELDHGSLLVMKDETQHYWEHSVPKRSRSMGERINITFRHVYESSR